MLMDPLPLPFGLLHDLRHPISHLKWLPTIRLAFQPLYQQRISRLLRRSEDLKVFHIAVRVGEVVKGVVVVGLEDATAGIAIDVVGHAVVEVVEFATWVDGLVEFIVEAVDPALVKFKDFFLLLSQGRIVVLDGSFNIDMMLLDEGLKALPCS